MIFPGFQLFREEKPEPGQYQEFKKTEEDELSKCSRCLLRMKEEDFEQVIDVNLKGTFLVTQVGYQAHALVLFKCFKIADSRQSDEGESVGGIHCQHCQHCSEDWEHWSGQLYSRQQLEGDEEHSQPTRLMGRSRQARNCLWWMLEPHFIPT